MYTRIEIGGWDDSTDEWDNNFKQLYAEGCSCCSSKHAVTPERVAEAIKEAEMWLAELQDLQSSLRP